MLKLSILPSDLVLEVGSGDDPYPQSDVLVDKFIFDSKEREANLPLVVDRPVILADACSLPFADNSFDYVIASHILEHIDNPEKFIREITRVAKRGYIETPSALRERVFNWSFHKWYVDVKDNCIYLTKKTKKSGFKRHNILSQLDCELLTFFEGRKLINCCFEWEGKIKYMINSQESGEFLSNLDLKLKKMLDAGKKQKLTLYSLWLLRQFYLKSYILPVIVKQLRFLKWRMKKGKKINKKVHLELLLTCLKCKRKLVKKKSGYECERCCVLYPEVKKGVINFLAP